MYIVEIAPHGVVTAVYVGVKMLNTKILYQSIEMDEKFIVAIEIGSSKIKGALASIKPSGTLNVLAVSEEPLVDSVRYGQIKNVEEVSSCIDRIRRRLESSPSITPRRISGVYVGLSGLTVGSTNVTASINFSGESEVTASTIEDLKQRAVNSLYTDKDTYQVLPVEYFVDNMAMANPVGTFGETVKGSFVIIQGQPGLMANIKRTIPERLQLPLRGTIVAATAQAQAVLTPDERRLGVMFVDFGAETTTVAIYKGGVLRYLATLPMGSRNITRDLMALNYLEEHADAVKRSNGIVNPELEGPRFTDDDGMQQPEINQFITARATEIIANILAQIEYAGLQVSDLPGGIVVVGGGARMKGFSDLLASESKMNVRTGSVPRNIRITDTSINADDAVDVISLLIAAVALGDAVVNCVEEPVVVEEKYEGPHIDNRSDGIDDDDEYTSRVGSGYDDDDDVLRDDPDDDEPRHKVKNRKDKVGRNDRREKPKNSNSRKSGGFFNFRSIRDRIADLVSDTTEIDDVFDDYDESQRNRHHDDDDD